MQLEPLKYPPLALFIILMAAVTATCARALLSIYIERPSSMDARVRRWLARWEFEPSQLGGFSYFQLALASLLGLFLEMLMIRWISSEIRIFAYFKNFVLISCFLGFGIGASLCRRRINLAVSIAPILLLTLAVTAPLELLHNSVEVLPKLLGATSEVQVWGVPYMPPGLASLAALALAVVLVLPLFMLIALVFIPIGQLVGWYLEAAAEGISAYTVNVLASLVGIVLYTGLCFLYLSPTSWFALAGLMLVILLWRVPRLRWSAAAAFAVFVVLLLVAPHNPQTQIYWSPYQKLAITPRIVDGETLRYTLNTNDSWYQQIIDLSPAFVQAHPALFSDLPLAWNAYNIPYHFYAAPPSVLVLGSGMGNDVAAALRNGAGQVVAVEIDPLILRLGRRLHFEKPYDSPRVQAVLDDARSYIQNSDDRFDLIVFSLLDSHTTSSHFSNIRIDNYVYTVEALRAARRLLQPDGVFIVKFQVEVPWLAGRLERLLTEVFGQPPLRMAVSSDYSTPGHFFITGSPQQLSAALADPALSAFMRSHGDFPLAEAQLTTDDWPYFYQRAPGLPLSVIVLSGVVVLACWYFVRRTVSGGSIRWHFFRVPVAGSANREQDGVAVRHHLDGEFHRCVRVAAADYRFQLLGQGGPANPRCSRVRRNFRLHGSRLFHTLGKTLPGLILLEDAGRQPGTVPAGVLCRHRVHPQLRWG
jgi:spermidine synthase